MTSLSLTLAIFGCPDLTAFCRLRSSAASFVAAGAPPGLGGAIGARGDLHVSVLEDFADRLDPERLAVLVNVFDQHRGGHLYLIVRSALRALPVGGNRVSPST